MKIRWTDRITNAEVINRMKTETEITNTIKIRKLIYFNHVMRYPQKYNILNLIIQRIIEERRGPGRKLILWLKILRRWFGQTTGGIFRAAANKIIILSMIANIRRTNTAH